MTPENATKIKERVQSIAGLDPKTPMALNGQTYILEFDNRAIKELYSQLELNLLAGQKLNPFFEEPDSLSKIVLIGLKKHHPDITIDEVDSILSMRVMHYIINRVTEAVNAFFPDVSDLVEDKTVEEDPMVQPIQ